MKKLTTTLLIFLFFTSQLQFAHANLCSDILNSRQTIELPRELNASPEVLARIAENGHYELLSSLSSLFTKYQDPVLLNKLSYSFRRYNIDQNNEGNIETPLATENSRGLFERLNSGLNLLLGGSERRELSPTPNLTFDELWATLPVPLTHRAEMNTIRPMFFAVRANLDGGFLTDPEILITVILMDKGHLDFKYRTDDRLDIYARQDHEEVTEQEINIAKAYAGNPTHLRSWNILIKDSGFKLFVRALLDMNSISQSPMGTEGVRLIEKVLKKSFQFKANSWQTQSTIGLLLTLVEDHVYDYSASLSTAQGDSVNRVDFINALEEILVMFLEDSSLARSYLNLQDFFVFRTPFPVRHDRIAQSFIEGAKNTLLSLKSEASAQIASEAAEARQAELEESRNRQPLVTLSAAPIQATQKRPERRNPRKRRNHSCPIENPRVDSEIPAVPESAANLCPDTQINANTDYTFYLLRNPEMPLQTIQFSPEIVDEFNAQNTVNWPEFLRPLLYGFTSENGQNGIKKLGANMNLKDVYEIKPGVSSYRIIIRRRGNTWRTIAFLHKDNIDRFLNSL